MALHLLSTMNARKFLFTNIRLAVGLCGVALASRAFRYFEYKGYYSADWLTIPRELMACGEHFLAAIGFPAMLVAMSWFLWSEVRSRTVAVDSQAMRRVDDYAAAALMFVQVFVYMGYAAYWEFASHGAIGPVTGKLANQFVYDVYGLAQYIAIMNAKRAFASTREMGREVAVRGFRFFGADAGGLRGATVADLARYHARYPRLGLYITMHDDTMHDEGSGELLPRLVFIWGGEEIFNPLCGSPLWLHADPALEYGISLVDALAIARINRC
ncbi:hypothetical protein [Cupriavidus sp. SW-Y-13]|uniref:hypothetical protein n=1 Tax=Cupriavidus sp. SW-Y-13 TaxID=2653854 RepID=UPI0013656510|nr:hypothetical protein [Cupriavidus sp. SW-Y-13]MWL91390.1 hypothetical protein [Cupriavidus sp. SW-Y-13]